MLERDFLRTISLSVEDIEALTFEDLRYQLSIGQSTSTGSGRNKEYGYKHGVKTPIGTIERSQWYQLMEALIKKNGETWLLDALIQWGGEHNYANEKAAQLRHNALQLHSIRIFDNTQWVCFIPFSQRYRPEALKGVPIVMVVNDCCGFPGAVTQAQLDRGGDNCCCPHCGRHSPYKVLAEGVSL